MHGGEEADGPKLVSYRTMDIVVSLFFLVACAVVIADSLRLGVRWRPNEGPSPGYFPFGIAIIMAVASVMNLIRALPRTPKGEETFVTTTGLTRMATIFVPAVVYALLVGGLSIRETTIIPAIGIYVSSMLYIAGFMIVIGGFEWWRAAAVSLGVSILTFFMFERWFLVPLPKGPLEAALGY